MLDESRWVEWRLTAKGPEMLIGDVLVEVVTKQIQEAVAVTTFM